MTASNSDATTPASEGLEPCPFCGSKAELHQNKNRHPNDGEWDVECSGCCAAIRKEGSPHNATLIWNRRAPIPTASPIPTSEPSVIFTPEHKARALSLIRTNDAPQPPGLADILAVCDAADPSLNTRAQPRWEPSDEVWQPIETAPKDGTEILGFVDAPVNKARVCLWRLHWNQWQSVPGYHPVKPTHWKPIPAPPSAALASITGEGT